MTSTSREVNRNIAENQTERRGKSVKSQRRRMNLITSVCAFFGFLGLFRTEVFAVDAGSRQRAFVQAIELFDAAKTPEQYRESARVLESILADGFQNGAVYYNLGNAYYRAGDYGRAILNYRKAKPYRPRDPYLKANLEQALKAAPGHLAQPPVYWWSHVLFWTDWFSFPRFRLPQSCSSPSRLELTRRSMRNGSRDIIGVSSRRKRRPEKGREPRMKSLSTSHCGTGPNFKFSAKPPTGPWGTSKGSETVGSGTNLWHVETYGLPGPCDPVDGFQCVVLIILL